MDILDRMDATILGDRLRAARTRAGLTQDDAAKAIKVSRTTMIALEKGDRRLRSKELVALADLYNTTANQLLRDSVINVELIPRFRALPETQTSKAEDAARLLNDLAAAEVELERLLGRPSIRSYPPERPIAPGDIDQQAEEAALDFRQRLGRGISPLKDLISLLESEIGIRVFIRPVNERNISGMFIFDEAIGACILLNAHHNQIRRRQSAAHECGHFVATRNRPDVDSSAVDTNSREERFARRFGFALLMPAAAVRFAFQDFVREHGRFSPRHLVVLAARFGVSNEALCRRLEDLSLLKGGTWESIKARGFTGEFAGNLLNGLEGNRNNFEQVTPRLWLLSAEAYERGLVTEGQLCQMLRLPRIEVRAILDSLDAESIDALNDVAIEN